MEQGSTPLIPICVHDGNGARPSDGMPRDGAYLMAAKTLTSLRRNVLDLLTELVSGNNFSYSLSKKEARLFGRLVYLEGVNDARAEGKIRGMTLTGAYCDELTLFTEDFFAMLLSRLSEHGAKLFATTNPDSPNHWLMLKYLKRADELDLLRLRFTRSPSGISVFANAIDQLEGADLVYDSYCNEFRLGKKRIIVPMSMARAQMESDGTVIPVFDDRDVEFYARLRHGRGLYGLELPPQLESVFCGYAARVFAGAFAKLRGAKR